MEGARDREGRGFFFLRADGIATGLLIAGAVAEAGEDAGVEVGHFEAGSLAFGEGSGRGCRGCFFLGGLDGIRVKL